MKNTTIIFTVLMILVSCNKGPKTKIVEKWETGKSKIIQTYDNPDDTLTFKREFYYKNGQLGSKGYYVNNKQDGLWEWWFCNGNKQHEAVFKNGLYVQYRKHWREDGTLRLVEIINHPCSDTCCDGKRIYYRDNGTKLIQYSVSSNGEWDGEGFAYFPDGKIARKFTYVNGLKQGMCYEYYENGKIEEEGNYINDKEDGKWICRDSTGKMTGYYIYKDGVAQ